MTTTITWSVKADFESPAGKDPSLNFEKLTIKVGGVDKVTNQLIERGAQGLEVDVQPSDRGRIEFFLINPSVAGDGDGAVKDLRYSFDKDAAAADDKGCYPGDKKKRVPLTGLQLFTSGSADWFDAEPTKLYFWNDSDSDVYVQIYVGRRPTA